MSELEAPPETPEAPRMRLGALRPLPEATLQRAADAKDWDGLMEVHRRLAPDADTLTNGTYAFAILYGLARTACIGRISPKLVEIGCHEGGGAKILAAVAEECDGQAYSMETDVERAERCARPVLQRLGLEHRWTLLGGSSHDLDPIADADFLYVDGDHSYDAVTKDMDRHGRAVRLGGTILLDDVCWTFPGKLRWVTERWFLLQPFWVGPYVMLRRRRMDDLAFSPQTNPEWNFMVDACPEAGIV